MSKRDKDRSEAVVWVGRWNDGSIGWMLPSHCCDGSWPANRPYVRDDDTLYRCRVTVEVIKSRDGRQITRKARTLRGKP